MALGGLGVLYCIRTRIVKPMKTLLYTLAGLIVFTPLSAAPITVTIGFTGSGTVGATAFTSASVLITAIGDTGSNTLKGGVTYQMNPTMTTIAITGFSLATVMDVNQNLSAEVISWLEQYFLQ